MSATIFYHNGDRGENTYRKNDVAADLGYCGFKPERDRAHYHAADGILCVIDRRNIFAERLFEKRVRRSELQNHKREKREQRRAYARFDAHIRRAAIEQEYPAQKRRYQHGINNYSERAQKHAEYSLTDYAQYRRDHYAQQQKSRYHDKNYSKHVVIAALA